MEGTTKDNSPKKSFLTFQFVSVAETRRKKEPT